MKRYMFYDGKTGEILHTHQMFKLGSDKPITASKEELALVARRMVHSKRARHLLVAAPPTSSRRTLRSVNPKTRKLVTEKVAKGYWLKEQTAEKKVTEPARGGR